MMNGDRIYICPINDGESVAIRNLLQESGETVIVTSQPWGATWQNLEPKVVVEVECLIAANPNTEIVGIELGGQARWNGQNVDHHCYKDDDRSNPKSSLEQIAEILSVELTRFQQLISANDKGWIPALEEFGASSDEIAIVRAQDRLAQGVTPDQEAQAVRDVEGAEWRGRKVLVRCPHGATSAVTDRLYGRYDEALTVDGRTGKWIYYGPRHKQFYTLTENKCYGARWSGGAETSGYSGVENPTASEELINFFFN